MREGRGWVNCARHPVTSSPQQKVRPSLLNIWSGRAGDVKHDPCWPECVHIMCHSDCVWQITRPALHNNRSSRALAGRAGRGAVRPGPAAQQNFAQWPVSSCQAAGHIVTTPVITYREYNTNTRACDHHIIILERQEVNISFCEILADISGKYSVRLSWRLLTSRCQCLFSGCRSSVEWAVKTTGTLLLCCVQWVTHRWETTRRLVMKAPVTPPPSARSSS